MATKAITPDMIRTMIAEAVAEALTGATEAAVVEVKPARKRKAASGKAAPKATSARRKRGEKASEWVVRESWKGEAASTRMLGFAVKQGVAAAILKRGDKFEVSAACGKALGLPVVIRD